MKRIFAAGISQESNSFNPLKSAYGDFYIYREQEFREMAGIKALIASGYEVVTSLWARAVPGGTLNFDGFMRITEEMLKPLEEDKAGFDGVFLPMHGALDVMHIGSGEAFIAARIREIIGDCVPVAAALDMHANITYGLASTCNIIYGFRTAPHTDRDDTHVRAACLLIKAVRENLLPRSEIIRIPLMMPGENMMSGSGIGKEIISRLPDIEGEKKIWCASYFVGMAWVDCPRNGAAVVVSGEPGMDKGMGKARDLAQFAWDNRDKFEYQGLAMEPESVMDFVKKHRFDGPVIVSDSADNVTAGAAGDSAFMLNMFLAAGIEKALFAAIIDPAAVAEVSKHKVNDVIDIQIGGAFDRNSEKAQLKGAVISKINIRNGTGKSKAFDEPSSSCVLSYKGIDILLFDRRSPVFSEETLNEHGLSLHDYSVLVVKQGYLSPELSQTAKHAVLALTDGNCNQRLARLSYKKLRRPVYPLDRFEG